MGKRKPLTNEALFRPTVTYTDKAGNEVTKKLTPREERFCHAYLIDFNGSKAARDAGYSVKTAPQVATENLNKLHIRARIQALRDEMAEGFNITRERIALEYSRIAFLDPRKFYDENGHLIPVHQLDEDVSAAIAGVELEVQRPVKAVGLGIDDNGDIVSETGEITTTVVKVKHASKREALDSLVKMMGYAAPTKTEVSGPDGQPINFTIIMPPGD